MAETTQTPNSETADSGQLPASKRGAKSKAAPDLWRKPYDLTPDLAGRLLRNLAPNHRHRLELFAHRGERISARALLAVTGDTDIRVLSYFQGALSRKLKRLVADPERKLHLIGWDYGATLWDEEHTRIVDGVCYVTGATREALIAQFGDAPAHRS